MSHEETDVRMRPQAGLATPALVESLRQFARSVARTFRADSAGAYLVDPRGEVLQPVAGYRIPPELLSVFASFPIPVRGHRLLVEAWEAQGPVFAPNGRLDERVDRETAERLPTRSLLFIPILEGGELAGGLFAAWWREPRELGAEDLALAAVIGRRAGAALPARRMAQEAERRLRVADELARAARRLATRLEEPAPVPEDPASQDAAGALDVRGGSETLLIVEDEDDVRELMSEILQAWGYTVLEARDGNEGLLVAEWHDGPIHLVVTDLVMPHVHGVELGQRLGPLREDAKLLYVSAFPRDVLGEDAILPPGVAFLPKPFTPQALARAVRTLLDGER